MVRCLCTKLDGRECSREASGKGSNPQYCWQHQQCKQPYKFTSQGKQKAEKQRAGGLATQYGRGKNEETAKAFVEATHSCDASLLSEILSEDAVWTIPGNSVVSGPARGRPQIAHRCQIIRDYGVTLNIERILHGSSDDVIAFQLHNTGVKGDRKQDVFDEYLTQVYSFDKSGKITSITNFIENVEMLNIYFAPLAN